MKKIKKFIVYIIFIYLFVRLFQIGFTSKIISTFAEDTQLEKVPYQEFDYGQFQTVKLLHTETGEVEVLPLDIYLYGVVSAEMPANFEMEALKAQAIVARTYTIYQMANNHKHQEQGADICDSPLCCQAWISKENRIARWEKEEAEQKWTKIENSVNATIGKIILYENQPIKAFFHSNSGGITESSLNVWGGDYSYLQSVQTVGEENYDSYESEVKISKDELIVKMKEKFEDFEINFEQEDWIKIVEKTDTSSRVNKIQIGNKVITGNEARSILGLKSTKFEIKVDKDDIYFYVLGYGHGVGMSQCGSDSLAKQGMNCEEIIHHYYQNVEIVSY
ncbi:MAG: stage II sporulation protein D [Clostridia bacterium]|nr:stage II sporulation protein D [Clostridia bacterium]